MIKNVLTIAGSDPSGGAGIQADLKTFSALGCYGMAALTALTAQNTQEVRGFVAVPPEFITDQLSAIFEDIEVSAVKIGMLANANIIKAVSAALKKYTAKNIVLDPVMVSTSGDNLIDRDAVDALKEHLIPMADLLTPNIPEAEKLSRKAVLEMEVAAQGLLGLGANAVLLKGGHLKEEVARDVLATATGCELFESPRIDTQNTHGTGCTLSSAIAAYLAHGHDIVTACGNAKVFLTQALEHADNLNVGQGHGPVNHNYMSKIYE